MTCLASSVSLAFPYTPMKLACSHKDSLSGASRRSHCGSLTSRTCQKGSFQNMNFFFHMGVSLLASFRASWLLGPFPKTTSTSLTILNISLPLWLSSFVRRSALPWKCLPLFPRVWFNGRNWWWPMFMNFQYFFKNIPSMSWKQCMHALYPLFDCSERLLRVDQSLIVMNNNARRSKCSYFVLIPHTYACVAPQK
jgi:hypothetical protein